MTYEFDFIPNDLFILVYLWMTLYFNYFLTIISWLYLSDKWFDFTYEWPINLSLLKWHLIFLWLWVWLWIRLDFDSWLTIRFEFLNSLIPEDNFYIPSTFSHRRFFQDTYHLLIKSTFPYYYYSPFKTVYHNWERDFWLD